MLCLIEGSAQRAKAGAKVPKAIRTPSLRAGATPIFVRDRAPPREPTGGPPSQRANKEQTQMQLIYVVILAAVQGLTELLPVSSSAHVIVTAELLHIDMSTPANALLLVMLHTGTMFA
ncbi:MAG: undecaprenyl-diphosphate phosphatase, partial [Acidobacteriota bacterium]